MLSEAAFDRALGLATEPPPHDAQAAFAARAALVLGGLLSVASVVFFVAHNWEGLSRWARFGALELGLVAFAAAAWRAKGQLTRQVALSLCAALLGPLLAVYGQTYQTGADPYELFLTWALLAAPIAALSRFMPLWLGVWALVNVSAALFCEQLRPFDADPFAYGGVLLAALNTLGLGAYELVSRRTDWLGERTSWFHRALAAAIVLPALPVACWYLAGGSWWHAHGWGPAAAAVVAGAGVTLAVAYRRDSFVRSAVAFCAIGLATAFAGRWLHRHVHEAFAWGLMGLFVVAELAAAMSLIRRAAR
ncbi:MAG: DUF2157 domain-containing protein [Myxococcaceae bacterium]|nr:DUF2157 domain-containing protein [Myxococcaceae bacterium]